jgi:hypothetical protein
MSYLGAAKLADDASAHAKRARERTEDLGAEYRGRAVDLLAQAVAEMARALHRASDPGLIPTGRPE